MTDFLAIHWHMNPDIIHIGGFVLRWYSVLFLAGFVLGWFIFKGFLKREGLPLSLLDPLLFTLLIATIVGARLGHCIFYQPDYYFGSWQGFWEIFMPWKGGLASHGGTIGLIVALWLYVRKTGLNFVDVLDFIAIATPFAGGCIRMGNLMNGEIVGKITDVPWAFLFAGYEGPRHPAQLYEAIAYFIMFAINMWLYKKYYKTGKLHRGFFFGLTIAMIFTFRFFIEFLKEVQVDFESDMALNMGQWLSVPFVILGVACAIGGRWLDTLSGKLEYKEKKLK